MSIFNCKPIYEVDYEEVERRFFASTNSLKEFEIPALKTTLRDLLDPFIVKGVNSRIDGVTNQG